jgi:hypothetical protein
VKSIMFALCILLGVVGSARELKDIKMDDSTQVNGKNLILNGMGLREKSIFGIPVKIYVAGLYLEKKSKDSDAIIKSPETKMLIMEMKQNVPREKMVDAFETSYTDNCVNNCDKKKEQFGKFKVFIPSVSKGDRLIFTYLPDKAIFEVKGKGGSDKKDTLEGVDFSQNLLANFINAKAPPTPELRKGLLGD